VFINVWTNHEIKFRLKGFKIGILGMKNECFMTATCHYSPWRVILLARRAARQHVVIEIQALS